MRIQILPLPAVMVGDDLQEPFALVFDQVEDGIYKPLVHDFAMQCGAKTFITVPQTVEIVDRNAEPAVEPVAPQVPVSMYDTVIRAADPAQIARDIATAMGRPARAEVEPEPLYAVVGGGDKGGIGELERFIYEEPRTLAFVTSSMEFLTQEKSDLGPFTVYQLVPVDHAQRLVGAGQKARQTLGIYGSMYAATGVPHPYDDHDESAPCCIVCGLGQAAAVHVTAGWPRLQRDRSEDDT